MINQIILYLKDFHLATVIIRLVLAAVCGGMIGYERTKKGRPAGLRTYMLTCVGSALTVLLATYEYKMLTGQWASIVEIVGFKYDASRYSAAVIGGIGFLGAGTILATIHQQVSGLSSATGLFATAIMGLAAGEGFYSAVIAMVIMLYIGLHVLYPFERGFKRRVRNITLYVEFTNIKDLDIITETVRAQNAQIFDIDMERNRKYGKRQPAAVLDLKLSRENLSHSQMLTAIAELPCVTSIQELIS